MELTNENYFTLEADRYYMSNSQYKLFRKCEAMAIAKLKGDWKQEETSALLTGKYVHAWNEGILDQFIEENSPKIYTRNHTKRAEFKKADEIIEIIKNDNLLMKALSGENEVIFTAEMFGAPWKILIDSYLPDEKRFGDLKVLKDIDNPIWSKNEDGIRIPQSVFEHRGYFDQMAIYSEIERLANKRTDHFEPFLAVVTKEPVPDKAIISFVSTDEALEDFLSYRLYSIEQNMERILSVKNGDSKPRRCENCEYCRSTKKLKKTTFYKELIDV